MHPTSTPSVHSPQARCPELLALSPSCGLALTTGTSPPGYRPVQLLAEWRDLTRPSMCCGPAPTPATAPLGHWPAYLLAVRG